MVDLFDMHLSNTIKIAIIKTLQPSILKLKLEAFTGVERFSNTGCKSKLNIGIV